MLSTEMKHLKDSSIFGDEIGKIVPTINFMIWYGFLPYIFLGFLLIILILFQVSMCLCKRRNQTFENSASVPFHR